MRKRNKPFLLATLLIIFIAAAVAMNGFMTPKTAEQLQAEAAEAQKANEPQALGESRTSDNKGAASAAASAIGATAAKPRAMMGGPEGPKSIKRPAYKPIKPEPSESATSQQWYTDDSGIKKNAGKSGG